MAIDQLFAIFDYLVNTGAISCHGGLLPWYTIGAKFGFFGPLPSIPQRAIRRDALLAHLMSIFSNVASTPGHRIGPNARYYEDFQVGDAWESPRRTITETDIAMFAAFSGDYNPVHTDEEFAKSTLFGGRVLHGPAGFAIATGLESRLGLKEGTAIAFLGMTWDFKAPIRIADTVVVHQRVVSKRETRKSGTGIVTFHVQLANQRNEVVQEGEWKIMMMRRT